MEIVKTLLMGCGALALLSMVGCMGLVGVGTYAVDQAMESEVSRVLVEEERRGRPEHADYGDDPFSEYDGDSENSGWSDDAR